MYIVFFWSEKKINNLIKENAKQATMSFLVEVIPPLIWIILQGKF